MMDEKYDCKNGRKNINDEKRTTTSKNRKRERKGTNSSQNRIEEVENALKCLDTEKCAGSLLCNNRMLRHYNFRSFHFYRIRIVYAAFCSIIVHKIQRILIPKQSFDVYLCVSIWLSVYHSLARSFVRSTAFPSLLAQSPSFVHSLPRLLTRLPFHRYVLDPHVCHFESVYLSPLAHRLLSSLSMVVCVLQCAIIVPTKNFQNALEGKIYRSKCASALCCLSHKVVSSWAFNLLLKQLSTTASKIDVDERKDGVVC